MRRNEGSGTGSEGKQKAARMRTPRRLHALAAGGMLLLLPGAAQAHTGSTDTLVVQILSGTVDFSPGLCAPGDTPDCVGPYEAQFRLQVSTCSASGTFEGAPLAEGMPCGGYNVGFVHPPVLGLTKPTCASARIESSHDAKGFGRPANYVVINGEARNDHVGYVARAGLTTVVTGWVDDADPDTDPTGDHTLVGLVHVTRPAPALETGPCFTTPLAGTAFSATVVIS